MAGNKKAQRHYCRSTKPVSNQPHQQAAAAPVALHDTSEASLEAFEEIKNRRSRLYKPILSVTAEHGPAADECLTSREILRALIEHDNLPSSAEVLSVRPRLTELLQAGCLENPLDPSNEAKFFLKSVEGECRASVWRITERGRVFLVYLSQVFTASGNESGRDFI